MGDDDHGHALLGQILHGVEHLTDHLRIERRRRLIEEHHLGLHRQRTSDGDTLLLTTRQLPGVLLGLLRDPDLLEELHPPLLSLLLGHPSHLSRRECDVVEDCEVWEQVELLENHPGLATDLLDVLDVSGKLDPIHHDPTVVVLIEPIYASDHRGFARARRADHNDDFLPADREADVLERLE